MNAEMLVAINMENMKELAQQMIRPSRDFTGGSYEYEVDLKKDAIDDENFTVRTDVWMNTMLEQDDFSKWVNRLLYVLHDSNKDYDFWDYNLDDLLESLGVDIEVDYSGYTYNDPDHCRLDRNIHYTQFKYDGDYYIVFAVHHGADARAGFGYNAVFKVKDSDYLFSGMEITGYIRELEEDLEWYQIDNVAEYDKENKVWIHKETGYEVELHSSANGF